MAVLWLDTPPRGTDRKSHTNCVTGELTSRLHPNYPPAHSRGQGAQSHKKQCMKLGGGRKLCLWALGGSPLFLLFTTQTLLPAGYSFTLPPPDPELSSPLALFNLNLPFLGWEAPMTHSLPTLTCLLVSFPDVT